MIKETIFIGGEDTPAPFHARYYSMVINWANIPKDDYLVLLKSLPVNTVLESLPYAIPEGHLSYYIPMPANLTAQILTEPPSVLPLNEMMFERFGEGWLKRK